MKLKKIFNIKKTHVTMERLKHKKGRLMYVLMIIVE